MRKRVSLIEESRLIGSLLFGFLRTVMGEVNVQVSAIGSPLLARLRGFKRSV
jgi:hypothetical protein